jgi:hypothetical protein
MIYQHFRNGLTLQKQLRGMARSTWYGCCGDGITTDENLTCFPILQILKEEQQHNIVSKLHHILRPFLLRRLKVDVELNLPPRYERIVAISMAPEQVSLSLSLSLCLSVSLSFCLSPILILFPICLIFLLLNLNNLGNFD